jgi:dihydropyrimidinase
MIRMDNRRFDLVVRGATVVTADGRTLADVGVLEGKVGRVGGAMQGAREIDAHGLHLLPGAVDPHVHLTTGPELPSDIGEPRWVDDFTTGSAAALAAGITTLGNMTFAGGIETMQDAIARESGQAIRQAIADVFLHPVWAGPQPSVVEDLQRLCEAGHRSFKLFTCIPEFDNHGTHVVRAMQAARTGGALTLMHCEDAAMVDCCTRGLVTAGRGFEHYPHCRPPLSEVVAVQRAVALCELTGAPTYIVHLSCARALRVCQDARARGLPVYVETRPLYLHLTEDLYQGQSAPLFVGQPPLRTPEDREALWAGLADGSIHTVGSDHAPWRRADKMDARHTLDKLRAGVAELDSMMPMLVSEGVHARGLPLERLVAVTAANPARLFGLYPRKGTIAVGSDADLVLWDLQRRKTMRAVDMRSRADYSVYEGTEVTGWPVLTIRRGEVVFEDGQLLGKPGSGQVLERGPTQKI